MSHALYNSRVWTRVALTGTLASVLCGGCLNNDAEVASLISQIRGIPEPATIYISTMPQPDAASEAEYKQRVERRNSLIQRLFEIAPNDPHVPDLMLERWKDHPNIIESFAEAKKLSTQRLSPAMEEATQYFLAKQTIQFPRNFGLPKNTDPLDYATRAFLNVHPHSKYEPDLLWQVHQSFRFPGPIQFAEQRAIEQRILNDFPNFDLWYVIKDLRDAGATTAPLRARLQMSFDDAISGQRIDSRGKVLILDGWATYCASCIAIIPDLKALDTNYKDKGLLIVGTSMDGKSTGGLEAVSSFTEKNGCTWPQFYEGGYGKFCSNWKLVGGTPYVFDRKGHLVAANPKREDLEPLVKELLRESI